MQAPVTPCRLLDLPAELRLKIYDFVQQHSGPLYPDMISNPAIMQDRIWRLRLSCKQVFREVQAPELFVTVNTWWFSNLAELRVFVQRMPQHTMDLMRSVYIDDVHGLAFWPPYFYVDGDALQVLRRLPKLERLTIKVSGLNKVKCHRRRVWLNTLDMDRDARFALAMQTIIQALPIMPRGLVLEVRGYVLVKKHITRVSIEEWLSNLVEQVEITLTYRYRGAPGWDLLATVEVQPTYTNWRRGTLGHWLPDAVWHEPRTVARGPEAASRLMEVPWRAPR
ncbi:hypothetical protein LTR85_006905 [Meristemomyces frigidus]|nr:hypothetical protein LTR85_006905 [Meristemomyces frigidus]